MSSRTWSICLFALLPLLLLAPVAAAEGRIIDGWEGQSFPEPVWVGHAGDGTDDLYVGCKKGSILRVAKWRGGQTAPPAPFLDISSKVVTKTQGGICGVAFHPKYRENGRFFVTYLTSNANPPFKLLLSEFQGKGGVAAPASERVLLEIPKSMTGHNGGGIEFGPDGKLWMGTGDNQIEKDAITTAQSTGSLLGKLLRIDVDAASPGLAYGIPSDNPWPKTPGVRPEIWAYGFRNVWRFCFDASGAPWVASPGAERKEWLQKAVRGGNHGWPFYEGTATLQPITKQFEKQTFVPVAFEYDRAGADDATAIVGGRFYRGDRVKSLKGKYVFADYSRGKIYALTIQGDKGGGLQEIGQVPGCSSVGEDAQGELFFCSFDDNKIFTLAAD